MATRTIPPGRRTTTRASLFVALGLLIVAILALGGPGALRGPASAEAASGIDPNFVSFTIEGCRNNGGIVLPNGDGNYICPDAVYTTGNLGKAWSELDLVPFRTTTELGTQSGGTTTYDLRFALDSVDGAAVGYDVISVPVVNDALSDDSCSIVSSAQQGDGSGTIYRLVTVTQNPGTTCVFDWYGRLAIGAHLYPGASLHANLFNKGGTSSGIGQKDVSIPVNEIAPQELRKDMTATRDADHVWNLTKGATPASLDLGNVCDPNYDSSQQVSIKIEWTRLAASPSGNVTIVTNVYAKNPASRAITTTVTDKIYEGSGQTTLLDTKVGSPVSIPANTEVLVLTHTFEATSSATSFNDVATASYLDTVTNVPIPQTSSASASANVQTGSTTNESAGITDTESITGAGLTFSADSASSGSFTGGYVEGTATTGPVGWASGTQNGSGDATLSKTIYAAAGTVVSGSLDDTASLTGSDGASASAEASVAISNSVSGSLKITKTIPNVLSGSETAAFSFLVTGPGGYSETVNFSFAAGETSKDVTLSNLAAGDYLVHENAASGWAPQSDQTATVSASSCSPSSTFNNGFAPASARAAKDTDPDGSEAGWVLTLNGPGVAAGGESVTTTGAGFVGFSTVLQEGNYTISETLKDGWSQTSTSGCSFSVNYPADAGKVFSCTIKNTSRGSVKVVKSVSGGAIPAGRTFTFQLRQGASNTAIGDVLETLTASAANSTLNFTTQLIPGNTYQMCEAAEAGWMTSLGDPAFSPFNPNSDQGYLCSNFVAGFGTTVTFRIDNTPPPGGAAATIGFWKNHASCASSSGKQKDVLDTTLALAIGGIDFGAYQVDTCAEAVALLNKSTLAGKKMASDPLFNMAAQLMAADLNILAGAAKCATVVNAISAAHALLDKYAFNGTSYSPKLSAADATSANNLAKLLDAYNNNDPVC
jgi:hypothetical protein